MMNDVGTFDVVTPAGALLSTVAIPRRLSVIGSVVTLTFHPRASA